MTISRPRPQRFPIYGLCTQDAYLCWQSVGYTSIVDVRSGVKDPKWKEKVLKKVDATNPYSCTLFPLPEKGQKPPQPVMWKWVNLIQAFNPTRYVPIETVVEGFPHYWYLQSPWGMDDAHISDSYTDSRAKLAFLGKIRNAQSEFSAPTFLGELKETIRMLRHPLRGFIGTTKRYNARMRRLESAYRRALRRNTRSKLRRNIVRAQNAEAANRLQRATENAYLQWVYGIAPLLNDVEALLELPTLMGEAQETVRLSVTIPRESFASFTELTHWNSAGHARAVAVRMHSGLYKSQIRGAIDVRVNPPDSTERLRELTKFNLEEFVPTMYELLPFSFIADYFSSLGDVVNGVFTSTSKLTYCCHTRSMAVKNVAVLQPVSGSNRPVSWPFIGAMASHRSFRLNRVKTDLSVNLRDLRFRMPDTDQLFKSAVLSASLLRRQLGDV